MANIDINEHVNLSTEETAEVKGGPAYIKFDGVDGEAKGEGKDKDHGGWSDILSVRFRR